MGGKEGLTTTTTITTFLCSERWPVNQGFLPGYGGLASARSKLWVEGGAGYELQGNHREQTLTAEPVVLNKHHNSDQRHKRSRR